VCPAVLLPSADVWSAHVYAGSVSSGSGKDLQMPAGLFGRILGSLGKQGAASDKSN
jgi:hypothetical protein